MPPPRKPSTIIAFTLAEVLITLGIIGVVASLTLPTLIQNHNNQTVESKLKKFYSIINQAVLQSENEYGDKSIWWQDLKGAQLDENGDIIVEASEAERWFMYYIGKNLNIVERKFINGGTGFGNANGIFVVYFADGTAFGQMQNHTTRDWVFYTNEPEKCINKHGSLYNALGKCAFAYNFMPSSSSDQWKYLKDKGFEPYKYNWNGDRNILLGNCKSLTGAIYCTALIQLNNWKIPDDYPKKLN